MSDSGKPTSSNTDSKWPYTEEQWTKAGFVYKGRDRVYFLILQNEIVWHCCNYISYYFLQQARMMYAYFFRRCITVPRLRWPSEFGKP